MTIRYEGGDGFSNLELSSTVGSSSSSSSSQTWQGNRNPFIDHPEWATAIWN